MQFLLEYFGLCKVEIKRLHPYPEELRVQQSLNSKLETNLEIIEKFNDFFYGPQDYAIIGYKI